MFGTFSLLVQGNEYRAWHQLPFSVTIAPPALLFQVDGGLRPGFAGFYLTGCLVRMPVLFRNIIPPVTLQRIAF
jgi:hypothetical protein